MWLKHLGDRDLSTLFSFTSVHRRFYYFI